MKTKINLKKAVCAAVAAMIQIGTAPATISAASDNPTSMDYHLQFNGNLNNENGEYPFVSNFTGAQKYVEGRKGNQAINLDRSNYLALDKTDDLIDYNQSFTVAYWINVNSVGSGSDPVIMSNKNWSSGGNNGWLFTAKGGMIKLNSKSRSDAGRVNGGTDIEITNYTRGEWVHIAAVWDKNTNTVKTYANGLLTNDYETNLTNGMAGNNAPTLIGQSNNSSTANLYNTATMFVDFRIQDFFMTNKALTEAEIEYLYGEPVIRPKQPLGYTLTTDKTDVEIGDVITTTLQIENNTGDTYENISAELITSATSTFTAQPVKRISAPLADGETAVLTWTTEITQGGLISVFAQIKADGDAVIRKYAPAVAAPYATAGWYKTDTHIHTTYSDGGGSVASTLNQAKLTGVNSPVITDHGTSIGWNDALTYMANNPEILSIRGNEYTNSNGHAVVLFVNEQANYNNLSWTNMIERAKNMDSLLYIAHAFEGYSWRFGWDDTGYNGLEVWNNWWAPRFSYNANAFAKWDELNNAGRKIYGIANTDAHSVKLVGQNWMSVYLPDGLSADNLKEGMRAGRMYGSNGPHLEFTAEVNRKTAMMGDSMGIATAGQDVNFNIKGNYAGRLHKLLIIKNGSIVETILIGDVSFDKNIELSIMPGDFVRVELEGYEENGKTFVMGYAGQMDVDGVCAPFAFSNPIFFDEDDSIIIEVESVVPSAFVTKANGNTNILTIAVTEIYTDGTEVTLKEVFTINNNDEGTYEIGDYMVYVDTKGNTQIRACYIVD
jgi:hypothetical protein